MGNFDNKPVVLTALRFICGQLYAGGCMLMSAIAAHTSSLSPWRLHVYTQQTWSISNLSNPPVQSALGHCHAESYIALLSNAKESIRVY